MDLRFIAQFAAIVGGMTAAVVAVAGVVVAVVPGSDRKVATAPPPLFVNSSAEVAVREPAPLPPVAFPVVRPELPPLEATAEAAPPRPSSDILLGRPAQNPLVAAKPAKTVVASLPAKPDVAAPAPRPEPPTAAPAPIPQRPQVERRADGVLTGTEIRRIRAALRLTPEQERYWPPVEALLQEISTQQTALVQAGRPPTDAFGIGLKLRAYSATKPLIALLQEDQKAEIRRRARAMGFDAVASAI